MAGARQGADPVPAPAPGRLGRWALGGYRRLPRALRVRLVRWIAPSHTVGAICFIEHEGRLLMLRQRHRQGWTLPGGLVDRGETAAAALRRELAEELGLDAELGLPLGVVVDPATRRVDVIYHLPVTQAFQPAVGSEVIRARWLHPAEAGTVDEPTAQAFDVLARSRRPDAHRGRLTGHP